MSFGTSEIVQEYDQDLSRKLGAELTNFSPLGYLWHNNDVIATALTVSLPTAGSPVVSTGWQDGLSTKNGFVTVDGANGQITIGDKGRGIYTVKGCLSFSSSKNNVAIHGRVFVTPSGGSAAPINEVVWERDIGTANAVGDARRDAEVLLHAGDVLDYRFESDANTTTITVRHAVFSVRWYSGG